MANTFTGFLDGGLDKDGNRVYSYRFPSETLIGPRNVLSREDYLQQKRIAEANRIALDKQNKGYSFLDSPLGTGTLGLVSDVERVSKYGVEAGKTGFNKIGNVFDQYITKPISTLYTDTSGRTPNITDNLKLINQQQIDERIKGRDVTFDKPNLVINEGSLFGDWAKSTANFLAPYLQKAVDLPPIDPDSITNIFEKDIDSGKIQNSTQTDVNSIINATSVATNSNGTISSASNQLTEAMGTDKKTEGFLDKLNSGIDTFLNDLDKPGFQTALAMHMEAKNGGDITSVLFEGMKVKKKAKKDALAAHANNLAVSKAELQILKLYQDLNKADEPSKNLINAATTLMEKQYELGDQSTGAGFAVSSIAMGIKKQNPNMTEYEALLQAVQLAESTKALEKDKWFTWGGKFDPSKLFTATAPTVSTGVPTSKADMLKQLMAANTGVSEAEILQYINTTYPSLQ
ncbi:hypothetical protein [uncultured Mediterranean phage uvMED]|nr:hypothetical protein [uncultured Mediterranean phage uvMED]